MQMNLCLSGLASCYRKVAYPGVVVEAVALIRKTRPDAVTLDGACRNDSALIARRTGYHLRFSVVIYGGGTLRCTRPGDRGVFGDAVLAGDAIEGSDGHAFESQTDIERRRWLCVTTRVDIDVCTAHLSKNARRSRWPRTTDNAPSSRPSLRGAGPPIQSLGGDVNRRPSCAPPGFWTRTDRSATQTPGLQHVYGTGALSAPSVEVLPATRTDHECPAGPPAHLGARP